VQLATGSQALNSRTVTAAGAACNSLVSPQPSTAGRLVQLATAWPALNSRTVTAADAAGKSFASPQQPDGHCRWCSSAWPADGHRRWCSWQELRQPSTAGRSPPLVQLVTAWPALNSLTVIAATSGCRAVSL